MLRAAILFICLLMAAGPCLARDPQDFNIRSERGDLIRVEYLPIMAKDVADRADVCFAAASGLSTGKTFVLNHVPVFTFEGIEPGPVCRTIYTGFDYDSRDVGRERGTQRGRRGRAFGAQVVSPRGGAAQIAFYRDADLTQRLTIITADPLMDVYTDERSAREIMLPLTPGYRVTLTWLSE